MKTDANHPSLSIDAALAELDAAERGFVLGTLLAKDIDCTSDGDGGLEEPAASRCRDVLSILMALPRPERVRWIGLLAREALAPMPTGIEDVRKDILEETLRHQSPFVIRLLAAQGPSVLRRVATTVLRQRGVPVSDDDDAQAWGDVAPEVVAEIQRAVLARVVSVPSTASAMGPVPLGRRLATLPGPDLLAELTNAGAHVLGVSLRGADDVTLKRAIAHVGPAWSERITSAAGAPATSDETAVRDRARRLMKALGADGGAQDVLARLGARDVGDRLGREDPDACTAIAQRLPPDLRHELFADESAAGARSSSPSAPPRRR